MKLILVHFFLWSFVFVIKSYSEDNKTLQFNLNPSPKINFGKDLSFKAIGFLQTDAVFHLKDNADHPNGTHIRRARVGFLGKVKNKLTYKFLYDFGHNNPELQDAYISYHLDPKHSISFGQFKEAIGLEWQSASPNWMFMELPVTTALTPRRSIGLSLSSLYKRWSFDLSLHGENTNKQRSDDEGFSLNFHGIYTYHEKNDRLFHLGMSCSYRKPEASTNSFTYKIKTDSSTNTTASLSSGVINNTDYAKLICFEKLFLFKNYKIQGEYSNIKIERDNSLGEESFQAYYIQASKILTKEKYSFSRNKHQFNTIKTKSVFDGGRGAWELAVRYGLLDLNSQAITQGQLKKHMFAVNWYGNISLKVSLNYTYATTENSSNIANENEHIIGFRTNFKI